MSKKKKINKLKENTVRSVNNNIRSSVRKLNPILKAIVGKKVDVAIRELQFSAKRITKEIRKTVSSAVANAENNNQYDIDKLIVKEAYCGKKIVMKRFRPRAKGRAAPILKPYSSITIILSEAKKMPIKTWSRKSTIIPEFIGVSFLIYNGKKFIPVTISEDMVGHKLGEFSPTRTFFGHTPADKKAKPATAAKK